MPTQIETLRSDPSRVPALFVFHLESTAPVSSQVLYKAELAMKKPGRLNSAEKVHQMCQELSRALCHTRGRVTRLRDEPDIQSSIPGHVEAIWHPRHPLFGDGDDDDAIMEEPWNGVGA